MSAVHPRLARSIALHRSAGNAMVVVPHSPTHFASETPANMMVPIEIDGYVVDLLSCMDGVRSLEDVVEQYCRSYPSPFARPFARKALEWAVRQQDLVEWSDTRADAPQPVRITGSRRGFYPLHATVEIIETCNFTCAHCYYSSSPFKKGVLAIDQAYALFDRLAENGVRVVELTGGECTIHPDFRDILAYCAARFAMVAVISNGYRLGADPALAQFAGGFDNVIFQVSIDAIGARHDAFRKHDRSFDMAVRAVRALVAMGKTVRIASSISAETIDQVVPLVELSEGLGVANHSFAPVSSIGRGCNVTDPAGGARELVHAINDRLASVGPRPHLGVRSAPPVQAKRIAQTRNCGAGWRTVAIDYNGDVRTCNFSRDSKKLGNLLTESYATVFEQRAQFLFSNAPAPGGIDCQDCAFLDYCRGCFVKALTVSEKQHPACAWRARWFPGMALGVDADRAPAGTDWRADLPEHRPGEFAHIGHHAH